MSLAHERTHLIPKVSSRPDGRENEMKDKGKEDGRTSQTLHNNHTPILCAHPNMLPADTLNPNFFLQQNRQPFKHITSNPNNKAERRHKGKEIL